MSAQIKTSHVEQADIARKRGVPVVGIDMYSEGALYDPYPIYRQLRDKGGVVYLAEHGFYALTKFEQVRDALADWKRFSSADGVTMNGEFNQIVSHSTLFSDGARHKVLREVLGRPLTPAAVQKLREQIGSEAKELVERLARRGRFDGVRDLAQHLPMAIVSHLVGLPDEGRKKMLRWAFATFDAFGPESKRTAGSLNVVKELFEFNHDYLTREMVVPGSWMAELFAAADRGEITEAECSGLLSDYIVPSLDTTISATANALCLFAANPDQWAELRANPRLIPNAINEVVRIEAPVQGFSRVLREEYEVGGHTLPAGARVVLYYGSANRDEARWDNPDKFDVARPAADQLGFGHGVHRCIGANLARLEISALLAELIETVDRFHVYSSVRGINSVIRGWQSIDLELDLLR